MSCLPVTIGLIWPVTTAIMPITFLIPINTFSPIVTRKLWALTSLGASKHNHQELHLGLNLLIHTCIEYFCWVDYQGIDSLHVLDWDLCKFWFVFEFLLHKSNCKLHSTSMSSNDHSLKNLTWACIKNILKYTWTMVCIAGSSDLFMSLSMAVLPLVLRSVFEMVVI